MTLIVYVLWGGTPSYCGDSRWPSNRRLAQTGTQLRLNKLVRFYMLDKEKSRIGTMFGGVMYIAKKSFPFFAKQLGPFVVLQRGGKRQLHQGVRDAEILLFLWPPK